MVKFNVGKVYKTNGIDQALKEDEYYLYEIISIFIKFISGNWGNLEVEDKEANDLALINNERLLGAYLTSKGKVYITTERDRSYTTIMFAKEY